MVGFMGVEMPNNCRECFARECSHYNRNINYCNAKEGKVIESNIDTKRADWCPAIEIKQAV